ncbi:MAG: NAD(P)-binding domain-containing protein [Bryobacterales bacterium]|nr:NAD(P)-binding domain-containing protein [Bryobacterales bacterium]
METFWAFLIGFGLTLLFVSRYVRTTKLSRVSAGAAALAPAGAARPCPRCSKPVAMDGSFRAGCGAPMALWNVHPAPAQQAAGSGQKGKPRPSINASARMGCGSCVDACPEKGALTLSHANVAQTLRVPLVDVDFETNVKGLFIAGQLGGMGLIKTAINEGRMALEHVRRRLEAAGVVCRAAGGHDAHPEPPADPEDGVYDVAIVGAGPAGLSASLAAQQYGISCLTLEQGEAAATIRHYPRHKFLMAEPVEMPLYGSLYIADGAKEALLSVWETIIANTRVRIRTNERVESIRRAGDGGLFALATSKSTYEVRNVILALGKRGVPRRLGVPGEDLAKVTYRLIEAEAYENRDILIAGGGDSAIEAALAVSKRGRNRVTLAYRGDDFERARERNQQMLAQREAEGLLRVLRTTQVREILADKVRLSVRNETMELPNDFVIVVIGGESPEDFLRKTGVEIVEKAVPA